MTPAVQYNRPVATMRATIRSCGATASEVGVFAWGDTASVTGELPIVISAREAWLWRNPVALRSVRAGLEEARQGQTESLGSFADFAAIDDE